jgi:1,4-alpha-glucan branching enzyme
MTSTADPLDPRLQHLLAVWMPRQRWYPAKGRGVAIRPLGVTPLDDGVGSTPDVEVVVLVVGLDSGDRVDVTQVPLTFRRRPVDGADGGLVGVLDDGGGRRWVYDGPHDPAYVSALLRSLELTAGASLPPSDTPARVLSGEQSNTSVIVGADRPDATIVKVFRTLHPGPNPDVEVTAALAAAGCDRVAAVRGWSSGSWAAPDGTRATGHLAVAVEFLAGSEDAWREALTAADAGESFDERARQIGEATAAVHTALAEAFGRTTMSREERGRLLDDLRARVDWALASAPALEPYRSRLSRHRDGMGHLERLPDLQRIHGDFHLGQVLHSPARGWILLDFEGEPLRPLTERTRHDLTARDVAGMLRSFDYAARFSTVEEHDASVVEASDRWALSARDAFCQGYASSGGDEPGRHMQLLAALELDKALYEVVYETRNRPHWLPVPLHAVERLLG